MEWARPWFERSAPGVRLQPQERCLEQTGAAQRVLVDLPVGPDPQCPCARASSAEAREAGGLVSLPAAATHVPAVGRRPPAAFMGAEAGSQACRERTGRWHFGSARLSASLALKLSRLMSGGRIGSGARPSWLAVSLLPSDRLNTVMLQCKRRGRVAGEGAGSGHAPCR